MTMATSIYNCISHLIHVCFWNCFSSTVTTLAPVRCIFLASINSYSTVMYSMLMSRFECLGLEVLCQFIFITPPIYVLWYSFPWKCGNSAMKFLFTKEINSSWSTASISEAFLKPNTMCACGKVGRWVGRGRNFHKYWLSGWIGKLLALALGGWYFGWYFWYYTFWWEPSFHKLAETSFLKNLVGTPLTCLVL